MSLRPTAAPSPCRNENRTTVVAETLDYLMPDGG